jgi:hypothetical protein
MKKIEFDVKSVTVEVKARTRKTKWKVVYGEPVIVNVTGKSDEELHNEMMKDPEYRSAFEYWVTEERRKKLKRILKWYIIIVIKKKLKIMH